MKPSHIILTVTLGFASCSQGLEAIPATNPGSPTSTRNATSDSTQTTTPIQNTSTPTPIIDIAPIHLDIGEGVPERDVYELKLAVSIAQEYLEASLGGGIPIDMRADLTVRMESTGMGDACCASHVPYNGKEVMYFDLKHPEYRRDLKIFVHEYIHRWQGSLGCLEDERLPWWMNEGIAEYLAFEIVHDYQKKPVDRERMVRTMYSLTFNTPGHYLPLVLLERGTYWPGNIGYVAIDYLTNFSPEGLMSLRTVCEQIGNGLSVDAAFEKTFGMTKTSFYYEFEAYIAELSAKVDPSRAIRRTLSPDLFITPTITPTWSAITVKGWVNDPLYWTGGYVVAACSVEAFIYGGNCTGSQLDEHGAFELSLSPGRYLLNLNDNTPDCCGWYSPDGLWSSDLCATEILVTDDRTVHLVIETKNYFLCDQR